MPISDQLFGDDVENEFKKIETSNKLAESMRGQRLNPYPLPKQRPFGSQNFKRHNNAVVIKNLRDKAKHFLSSRAGTGHSASAQKLLYRARQSEKKGQGKRRF